MLGRKHLATVAAEPSGPLRDGRRRGPADTATTRPVNPQVRTRPGLRPTFGCVHNNERSAAWLPPLGGRNSA
jgi:hypothetical protein